MMQIEGLSELNAKLSQLAKVAEDVAEKEVADIALDLGAKASLNAPVLYGDLRGELARPRRKGNMSWQIGSSLPYTRYQHERTDLVHPRGGGAKFLEKAFRENVDKYVEEIGNAIERNLR